LQYLNIRELKNDREKIFHKIENEPKFSDLISNHSDYSQILERVKFVAELENFLDGNNSVFKFNKHANPGSLIKADYILKSSDTTKNMYVFLSIADKTNDICFCRSAFTRDKSEIDYAAGHTHYTLLYKEKVNLITKEKEILYTHPSYQNQLSSQSNQHNTEKINQIKAEIPMPKNVVVNAGAAVLPAPNRFSGFMEFLNDIKGSFTKLFQKHTKPETNADVIQKSAETTEETAENKEELQKNIPSGLWNLIEARNEYLSKKIEKSEYNKALADFMRSLKSESEINEAVDMLNEMSGALTAAEKNCVKNEIFNLQYYSRKKFHPENKSFLEELRGASADKSAKQHDDAAEKVYSPDRSNFDR